MIYKTPLSLACDEHFTEQCKHTRAEQGTNFHNPLKGPISKICAARESGSTSISAMKPCSHSMCPSCLEGSPQRVLQVLRHVHGASSRITVLCAQSYQLADLYFSLSARGQADPLKLVLHTVGSLICNFVTDSTSKMTRGL